jgi:hypothetical protein
MSFDPVTAGMEFVGKIIDKIFPDKTAAENAKLEMFKLQQQGELQAQTHEFELMIKQIEVNAVEAGSARWWVAGWRPFIGWIAGFSLAWNYVVFPFYAWTAKLFYAGAPAMFSLDNSELMTLLLGMLGLSGMRTYEKIHNATK